MKSTTASRVSKGDFTPAPHRTVREPLDSYGSSRKRFQLISRAYTPMGKQTGLQLIQSIQPSAAFVQIHPIVPFAPLFKQFISKANDLATKGLPTVRCISEKLNISPNYLSRLLKTLTGQSTQQFIHDKLFDLAKEKLSTTELSVSEIAYKLGFEHPQSFSKVFKTKTTLSPLEFRQSFN